MTHQENNNPSENVTELLAKNGWGALPELIRILINQMMQEERTRYLQAGEYERTENGQDVGWTDHIFGAPGARRRVSPIGARKGLAQ